MARKWLLALLALIIVTPALAQVMQVRRIPAPNPQVNQVQTPTDEQDLTFDITNDPERAKALIAKLSREKRELNAKLNEALGTIEQMTAKGGSLVKAYCESDTMSRSTAGASEDCSASGYRCAPVEGTCRKSCNVTTDCAAYHVCDTAAHVCVNPNNISG